jgi:diguanylate cyclase (GGDEF)-like protein
MVETGAANAEVTRRVGSAKTGSAAVAGHLLPFSFHLITGSDSISMTKHSKIALLYLVALVPLTIVALAWPVLALPSERPDIAIAALGSLIAGAATKLKLQLPRSDRHLTLSDGIVLLALLYFGGEYAVLMAAAAAIANAAWRFGTSPLVHLLTNFCIAVVTVFVTSIGILTFFGPPESVLLKLGGWTFVVVIGALALVPFALNAVLATAQMAIIGENHYWQELKANCADAILVHLGTALMAGLGVMAIKDTNVFLFFTIAGFFAILQIAFGRYRNDYDLSRKQVERSEKERSIQGEKHIAELKHYIDELERSSQALRESREKYRHAAFHDSLTGLPNRNRFLEVIDRLIQRCQYVPSHMFAVLYLDINRFKTINDSLGHSTGDKLIRNAANRLAGLVSGDQIIGRFSGDEFAILLPEISTAEDASRFAETVAEALSEPFVLDRRQVFTNVSIGIAVGNSKYLAADDVLRDVDIAMYRAKERKRSVVVFEEGMHVQAMSLLQLETDLRFALERNEFELFYQPIIELDSTRFAGVEALVRWSHPEYGQINPEKFIEVSEATGLIIPMTLQILEAACEQLNKWNGRDDGSIPLFVSVNLSGKHFNHPDVVEHIQGILEKTRIDPRRVKLEITETAVMDNAERASAVLRQIKDLGVQLIIDDFGTGYSSLSYLQRFPIDTLKIDRSFVRSMEDGRQNGEIVRSILALADAMKLSVVAEGIESVHQLHQLRILNCSYGQGYLFSHPLPPGEIDGLLRMPHRWENLVSGNSFSILPPMPDVVEGRVH